jgi:protein-S-isoprenylcysteine O-methyltransferase Ste14
MTYLIRLGQFFFKTRNYLFPILVLALYAMRPPQNTIFGSALVESASDTLAIILVTTGVFIRFTVMGFGLVRRDGNQKSAHASALFTKGMFGLSRNPLYLGNILIYTGVFMLHGAYEVFIIGTLLFIFIYTTIILSEETYLSKTFGADYAAYKARVPRLRLRLRNWPEAKKDMSFSWAKALLGEYNVATQAALMVAFGWWYEVARQSGDAAIPMLSAMLIASAFVFVLSMRAIKHDKSIRLRG